RRRSSPSGRASGRPRPPCDSTLDTARAWGARSARSRCPGNGRTRAETGLARSARGRSAWLAHYPLATWRLGVPVSIFSVMTFNKMGTVPLPLALHLAAYTVLGLFCLFAGGLNLIDPVKIPHGVMFLAVAGFSWGYVFGILMARKEVVVLGFAASVVWLVAAAVGTTRFGFDWRLTLLLVALGAYLLLVLALYRTRILEHC